MAKRTYKKMTKAQREIRKLARKWDKERNEQELSKAYKAMVRGIESANNGQKRLEH